MLHSKHPEFLVQLEQIMVASRELSNSPVRALFMTLLIIPADRSVTSLIISRMLLAVTSESSNSPISSSIIRRKALQGPEHDVLGARKL